MRTDAPFDHPRQAGLSLVELMVALALGALLTIGLLQIFSASRVTAQVQDGLSRVQENGRFATQYLQRQLRMVGYMGCGSDTGRTAQLSFVNHLSRFNGEVPGGSHYRFQRPLEAFTADTMPAPAEFAGVPLAPGSDVLILRVFSEESVPILNVVRGGMDLDITIADPSASFLPPSGKDAVFAMQNCRSADVFAGTLTGPVVKVVGNAQPNVYLDPSVNSCGGGNGCPWDFRISNASLNARPLTGGPAQLNAELHRAEYFAFYVRNRPGTTIPALYMSRLERDGIGLADPEELVEGIENMQIRFGYDTSPVGDGRIDEYRTAAEVIGGATDPAVIDENWRRVLSVRIAFLVRSAGPAAAGNEERTFDLLGTEITPEPDGTMRQVYETSVALRNRLFNS